MRLLLIAALTAVVAWLLQLLLPWWSVAIAAFVVCFLIAKKGSEAFFGALLGGLLLWMALSAAIELRTGSILTKKVAEIFFVQSPLLLIVVTGVVGGIAAMLPGLCGFYLRSLLLKLKSRD